MVKRKSVERLFCSGTKTAAEKQAFIRSALRGASMRWKPANDKKKNARVAYNSYKCAICGNVGPSKLPPLPGNKKKRNNAVIDHIEEVVSPATGWQGWDSFIERLYVEEEGYQILCYECNHKKTQDNQTERRLNK